MNFIDINESDIALKIDNLFISENKTITLDVLNSGVYLIPLDSKFIIIDEAIEISNLIGNAFYDVLDENIINLITVINKSKLSDFDNIYIAYIDIDDPKLALFSGKPKSLKSTDPTLINNKLEYLEELAGEASWFRVLEPGIILNSFCIENEEWYSNMDDFHISDYIRKVRR